jgi:hypothetical protein
MKVSVTLSPGDRHDVEPEVMFSAGQEEPASELRHETLLAAGVRVGVDLTTPHRWRSVTVSSWNTTSQQVVCGLIGPGAVTQINHRIQESTSPNQMPGIEMSKLDVDPSEAAPWLRIAVADALNRWLHLPLDQSLVDAERGIVRTEAALKMPEGAARTDLLNHALALSRSAAPGLTKYLRRTCLPPRPLPLGLIEGLRHLVDGYGALMSEVRGGDEVLSRVVRVWYDICESSPTVALSDPDHLPATSTSTPESQRTGTGLIDPRQVPARTLLLDPDPDCPEITVTPAGSGGHRNVRMVIVDVPVFQELAAAHGVGSRMLARLVERGTGRARGEALLQLHTGEDRRQSTLRGILRVPPDQEGVDLDSVRVDVFDALSEWQPALSENDPALQNVRRAILALREWRQLMAESRILSGTVPPSVRVRRIGRLLLPNDKSGARVCAPATGLGRQRCEQLSGLSDAELLELLRGNLDETPDEDGSILTSARGSSDLLVAELAAAHDCSLQ